MYIESISIRGLHQAIDADLEFQPDLGIMVGINGAGKTSIINLTAHLLRLNVPELVRIAFESIEILGKDELQKSVSIKAVKRRGELLLTAKRSGRKVGEYLSPCPNLSDAHPEEQASWERYIRRASVEITSSSLAAFIRENVRLTLVKLDRTLFAEDFTGAAAIEQGIVSRNVRRNSEENDPISQVERATRERFTEYQSQLKRLNDELKNKLVLQLFQATDGFSSKKEGTARVPALKEIVKLETSIKKSSFYPKNDEDQKHILDYFRFAKRLVRELEEKISPSSKSDVWQERFLFSAVDRFHRLHMLAEEFNTFDARANDAYKDVGGYLIAINSFLSESSKEAFFSESDNTLRFRIIGEADAVGRPIKDLSSGEKQIVTVLAYLAYLAGKNSIFVIDEPELSLHISWQSGLMAALKAVKPFGCQLLMATHSPEIVGDERGKVVRLIPKYRSTKKLT